MKNILLLIHDDNGQEARLQVALDLTRAVDGHLTCVDVVQLYYAESMYGGADNGIFVAEQARETTNRGGVERRLANEGIAWNWIDRTGDLAACVTQAAGLADLIVVNRRLSDDPLDMAGVAASVAIDTHKPVVAVADTVRGFDVSGRSLVAWDGSLPAMSALAASLPLLRLAADICILEIDLAAGAAPAEEAARYLSRHGVHADIVRLPSNGEHADAVIRRHAADMNASYLVMGAYGHSRTAEALFGGVTKRMLQVAELPLVLVH